MNSETEKAIQHLLKHDLLRAVIEKVQMPPFAPSRRIYYDLLESIVSQQLSVKVADVIFKRFLALFSDGYPHPEQVLSIEFDRLRGVCLSNQKANYLRNVAQFSLENDLENHDWDSMSEADIIQFLTQIKGVGKWTVEMLLMFTLGRPDVLPVDDLGIQQGMKKLFSIAEAGKNLKTRMVELAEPWRPYRTISCRYLWRYKDLG